MLIRVAALVVALTLPAMLPSQSLPRFSAEATMGQGRRPENVGELWYNNPQREWIARAGFTMRLGSAGRVRPVATVEYSFPEAGDEVLICSPAPNGSCRRYFPSTSGLAASVGVRAVALPRVTVGANVGLARYATTARYVDADLALRVWREAHLVVTARRLSMDDPAGPRVWFQPVSFGVRTQW